MKTRRILIALALLLALSALTSCGVQEKEFSKAGMTITLTSDFVEKDILSQTACYESPKYIVSVLKEEFSILESAMVPTSITPEEYAEIVISNNKLSDSKVTTADGIAHFQYTKEVSGKTITYYASCYKSEDAFWLFQFACEASKFDDAKADFDQFSKSVQFTSSSNS